jgi:hypothetical protein
MRHSIEGSSASVPSQQDLFWVAFITNIVGLDFQHTRRGFRYTQAMAQLVNAPLMSRSGNV